MDLKLVELLLREHENPFKAQHKSSHESWIIHETTGMKFHVCRSAESAGSSITSFSLYQEFWGLATAVDDSHGWLRSFAIILMWWRVREMHDKSRENLNCLLCHATLITFYMRTEQNIFHFFLCIPIITRRLLMQLLLSATKTIFETLLFPSHELRIIIGSDS